MLYKLSGPWRGFFEGISFWYLICSIPILAVKTPMPGDQSGLVSFAMLWITWDSISFSFSAKD